VTTNQLLSKGSDILSGYIAFTCVMCVAYSHPPKISIERIVLQIALFYAVYSIYPITNIIFSYLCLKYNKVRFVCDYVFAFFDAYKLGLPIVFVFAVIYAVHNEINKYMRFSGHTFNLHSFLSYHVLVPMISGSVGLIAVLLFLLPVLYYLIGSNKDKTQHLELATKKTIFQTIFVRCIGRTIYSIYNTISTCLFLVSICVISILLYPVLTGNHFSKGPATEYLGILFLVPSMIMMAIGIYAVVYAVIRNLLRCFLCYKYGG
jgi:hypothetical protein